MEFFKHFCNEHRDIAPGLMDALGHAGLAYWILREMCAEKIDKNTRDTVTKSDCKFNFHQRVLRQNLRMSLTSVRRLLEVCQTLGLLTFAEAGSQFEIDMPKLVESLEHRPNSRNKSGAGPAENSAQDKDKEEDKDKENIDLTVLKTEEVNWSQQSERVFSASRKWPSAGDDEKAREYLGPVLWQILIDVGSGLKMVRGLKSNAWEVKRIAELLKANHQNALETLRRPIAPSQTANPSEPTPSGMPPVEELLKRYETDSPMEAVKRWTEEQATAGGAA